MIDIYNAIHEYPLLVRWMERTAEQMESYYDRRYFLEPASGPTKRVAQWKQEQRRYRK
jgi:hypothetical protein